MLINSRYPANVVSLVAVTVTDHDRVASIRRIRGIVSSGPGVSVQRRERSGKALLLHRSRDGPDYRVVGGFNWFTRAGLLERKDSMGVCSLKLGLAVGRRPAKSDGTIHQS